MNLLQITIAALLYPGLLTAVLAGALFGLTVSGRRGLPPLGATLGTREGRAALAGAVFAGLGLASLPWPLHPAGAGASWLWAWAGFELAFLLPLLPALTAGAPAVVRAAIREAQIGALARATLWAALAAALAAHADWRTATLPAHLIALAVAVAALPAAIGSGPFAPEERVSPEGTEAGLAKPVRAAEGWARDVRSGALVAAVAVAALPVALAPPPLGLAMIVAGLVVGLLALARLRGRTPRLTLPAALRLFTLVGLPTAALASAALALAQRL